MGNNQQSAVSSYTPVFSYTTLRTAVGIIAFVLPPLVTFMATESLGSISASWHTPARDYFVGCLFAVGFFMFAYNGWSRTQSVLSKFAGLAAICVALFPTSADKVSDCCQLISNYCAASDPLQQVNAQICTNTAVCCEVYEQPLIHNISAAILFLILAAFCFIFFQEGMEQATGGMRKRSYVYKFCGSLMLACIAAIGLHIAGILWPESPRLIYWAELVALWSFGMAWIISGKRIYGFQGD